VGGGLSISTKELLTRRPAMRLRSQRAETCFEQSEKLNISFVD